MHRALEIGRGERGEAYADGVRIVYESFGAGPPLVCCHAFGVDRAMWQPQLAGFARAHRVVLFDQRGCGESDHPQAEGGEEDPYTIDGFATDLRAVLDALGIERARILGLSMGGATALRFATRWPERVDALVLVSTMASRLPAPIIERARKLIEVLESDGVLEAYRFYFGGSLFEGLSGDDAPPAQVASWFARATPHGFAGSYRVTIDRPSMLGELHRISAPTLVLVGGKDKHYLADAERMTGLIPNARKCIIEGAGHALTFEAPAAFEAEVLHFLDALPPGDS